MTPIFGDFYFIKKSIKRLYNHEIFKSGESIQDNIIKEFLKNNSDMTKIKRLLIKYFFKTNYPVIPSILNYFVFNEFIFSSLPEHIIFNKGKDLPLFLNKSYIAIINEIKKVLTKNYLVFEIEQKELNIPFIEERMSLYDSFLKKDTEDIYEDLKNFFKKFYPSWVSNFYYFESNNDILEGIPNYNKKTLDSLKGYEYQKSIIFENTKRFVGGKAANNVFLYGSRGTGKTSLIKALLEEFKKDGLRLIKVKKDDIDYLIDYLEIIRNVNYKFIFNIDDISYDENELVFKKHKVMIDSFFDRLPSNVIIYATSNSQDIVRFTRQESIYIDRREEEEKKLEPPQRQVYDERRAFTERFGITVFFGRAEEKETLEILKYYSDAYDVKEPLEILFAEYKKWVYYHGSINGRTIENFIKYYKESLGK